MLERLALWFLAYFRLSNYAICEMSIGRGPREDYHDYPDSPGKKPLHHALLTCARCGKSFYIAILWLLLVPAISLAQVVSASVWCPRMAVDRLSLLPNIWECAREIGTADLTFWDNSSLHFPDFEIAPTLVRKKGLKRFVDPCVQQGHTDNMDQLYIELPSERVILGVAKAMRAQATLTTHYGDVYVGTVLYPDSRSTRVGFGHRSAAAVTATGKLKRQ